MSRDDLVPGVLDALRTSVAVVDDSGDVTWANETWLRVRDEQGADTVAAVRVGANFIEVARRTARAFGLLIAAGVVAVLEGGSPYFELEYRLGEGVARSFSLSVTPLPGDRRRAVITQRDLRAGTREGAPDFARATVDHTPDGPVPLRPRPDTDSLAQRRPRPDLYTNGHVGATAAIEKLTAREREVLDLLARGLDNRAIAQELAISYTTVRGHVRSVIAKFGARSRLETIARAYQTGMVPPVTRED